MTLLLIALAGCAAQLVDGGLGMGFGATSTTILILAAGLGPAQASAVVHAAQLGTTLVSDCSHWRFGNVDWRVVACLGIPGAVGAFAGANALVFLSAAAARPVMAAILALIGANLVYRFSRGRVRRKLDPRPHGAGFLSGLGLVGGFIDATGGGGWGPVTTSTLLSMARTSPRRIVGTVNTAEFIVTSAAVAGFVSGLWAELAEHAAAAFALLIGGAVAVPAAAWIVTKMNPVALGGAVGTLLVVLNLPTVLAAAGGPPVATGAVTGLVAAAGVVLSARGYFRARVQSAGKSEARPSVSAPPFSARSESKRVRSR